LFAAAVLGSGASSANEELERELVNVELPPGFKISLWAEVARARSLAVGPPGETVYVGARRGSTIHLARDGDGDGRAEDVRLIDGKFDTPNGIAVSGGFLYIGENPRIRRWRLAAAFEPFNVIEPELETVFEGLPRKSHHGWRYIGFGPDRRLYVSVGSPCNICKVDGYEGRIIRMRPDGSGVETVASGIRNSVGFDWHPKTGEMFFTDNGADGLGDDVPADELNHVTRAGQFFGFPYFGGGRTRTPAFRNQVLPAGAVFPAIEFEAHTASLGVRFYTGTMFPAEYRNDAFVAQHGSWNRSAPIGYRIMRVRFDERGKAAALEVFAHGWLRPDGSRFGRPVDLAILNDGSMLVSDGHAGAIYRITYHGS
jgi:glucose/arabinose dehydrogenase